MTLLFPQPCVIYGLTSLKMVREHRVRGCGEAGDNPLTVLLGEEDWWVVCLGVLSSCFLHPQTWNRGDPMFGLFTVWIHCGYTSEGQCKLG